MLRLQAIQLGQVDNVTSRLVVHEMAGPKIHHKYNLVIQFCARMILCSFLLRGIVGEVPVQLRLYAENILGRPLWGSGHARCLGL